MSSEQDQALEGVASFRAALENVNAISAESYDQLPEAKLRAVLALVQELVDGLQRQERFAQAALVRRLTSKAAMLRELVYQEREHGNGT